MLRFPDLIAACGAFVLATANACANAEDYPTLDLVGRVHLDYAFYDEDVVELGDGGEIRRGRLGVKGLLAPDWRYGLSVEFAGGNAEIKDALIEFTRLARGTLVIGLSASGPAADSTHFPIQVSHRYSAECGL